MSALFIAEVSSNHNGSLARIEQFLDAALLIGADGVKFQLFRITQLFAPEALRAKPELLLRQNWELPSEFIPTISQMCHAKNLLFGCTPFHVAAVEMLAPYVDFFKVASYNILDIGLLRKIRSYGKRNVLSTGMATPNEVELAVAALGRNNPDILHCVSGYPTPVAECNLKTIAWLRQMYPAARIGYSDHSVNPGVLYAAILQYGAHMVEFHLDIDGQGDEYHIGHCWLPEQIKSVIAGVRVAEKAGGQYGKFVQECEKRERQWRADPSDEARPLLEARGKL